MFQRTKSKRNRIVGRGKPNDTGECLPAIIQRKNLKNLPQKKIYIYKHTRLTIRGNIIAIVYVHRSCSVVGLIMRFCLFVCSPRST